MKYATLTASLLALAASPAAGQLARMPVWNSPKGGTGITVSGDYGKPNDDAGGGSAFGARGSLGLGNLTLTAGVSSFKPDTATERALSLGANAAFRVIGGSLLPVAVNLQVGAATDGEITAGPATVPKSTTIVAGGGISASVPTPGISIEPYLSVTNRWNKPSGGSTDSNIGWTVGANLGFGMLGVHVAYDSQKSGGTTGGIFGIGAHVALRAPIGM
ncbi:MAG: hypothetical protein HYS40_04860 [Gemmatimonadetes bacterium]|nr:hypothetical protein [Gemmatimonadota bacterium]